MYNVQLDVDIRSSSNISTHFECVFDTGFHTVAHSVKFCQVSYNPGTLKPVLCLCDYLIKI